MGQIVRSTRVQGMVAWAWPRLLVFLLVTAAPAPVLAELKVTMTADRTELTTDDRLVLQVEVATDSLQGPQVTLPDLSDFQVLSQSVHRPMQFSFGLSGQQVRSATQYTFVLRPLREGRIEIGAVSAEQGGERAKSSSLTVQVATGTGAPTPAQAPKPEAQAQQQTVEPSVGSGEPQVVDHGSYVDAQQVDEEAFIRTVADKASPYEGEQVTVTIYLYSHTRLQAAPRFDQEPSTEGLWTQDLMEGQTLEELSPQQVNRRRYFVYVLRRFAAFPLRPGEVSVGAMALTIERPRNLFDMFGRGGGARAPIERTGVPLPLQVKPLPAAGRPDGAVTVGAFTIDAKLDRNQTATGDAVTLTATLSGQGQIQGARLQLPAIEGLEVLQPQVRDLLETEDDRVGGTRVFEWLLVPKRPGTYALPRLSLNTFEPASGSYATVEGPALSLTAAGRALAEAPSPSETRPAETGSAEEKKLDFGPVRTRSELLRDAEPISRKPWFLLAASLPWLLAVVIMVRDVSAGRSTARGPDIREQNRLRSRSLLNSAKEAARKGDAPRCYADASAAVQRGLEHRLGEQVGSFTRPDLRRRLLQAGLAPSLVSGVMDLLERCDAARFAPGAGSPAELEHVVRAAEDVQSALLAASLADSQEQGAPT